MTKKLYNQYCPISYALDVIGDRWTLHIIRDLTYGARRFTDLHQGLPGLATNLLSKRLKEMESNNLIVKKTLPPPISSTVYELTEHGKSLQQVSKALSNWGTQFLPMPIPDDDFLGIVPTMSALFRLHDAETAGDVSVTCEFHFEGDIFTARLDNGKLLLRFGVVPDPDAIIELVNLKTLIALVKHVTSVDSAFIRDDFALIDGDIVAFQAFVDAYPV